MAEKTRVLVTRWCEAEGLSHVAVDLAKLPADVEWALETHPEQDRTITVGQRKSVPDRIEVMSGLTMSADHAAAFQALGADERARFLYAMRRTAILLGVLYQGLSDPLVKMGFTQRVYVNALTKTSFMAAFHSVQNALILARGFVQIHLGPGTAGKGAADIEPDGPFGDFLSGLDVDDI